MQKYLQSTEEGVEIWKDRYEQIEMEKKVSEAKMMNYVGENRDLQLSNQQVKLNF